MLPGKHLPAAKEFMKHNFFLYAGNKLVWTVPFVFVHAGSGACDQQCDRGMDAKVPAACMEVADGRQMNGQINGYFGESGEAVCDCLSPSQPL